MAVFVSSPSSILIYRLLHNQFLFTRIFAVPCPVRMVVHVYQDFHPTATAAFVTRDSLGYGVT